MSANAAIRTATQASAIELIGAALPSFETLLEQAVAAVRQKVLVEGRVSAAN